MENNKKISDLMHQHHSKINNLLADLEVELKNKNPQKISAVFLEFKNNLENHFMAEEKYIFKFCEDIDNEKLEISIDLMQEHRTMTNMLKIIESDIKANRRVDDSDFLKIQAEHIKTEETYFYPELDIVLNEDQKKYILDNVKI